MKKLILVTLLFLAGLLLILAGLNLITLTTNLQLYSGLGLIVLAIILFFIY